MSESAQYNLFLTVESINWLKAGFYQVKAYEGPPDDRRNPEAREHGITSFYFVVAKEWCPRVGEKVNLLVKHTRPPVEVGESVRVPPPNNPPSEENE